MRRSLFSVLMILGILGSGTTRLVRQKVAHGACQMVPASHFVLTRSRSDSWRTGQAVLDCFSSIAALTFRSQY
jgi:hypothetical protein